MRIQRNWFEEGFAIPTSHLIYHKKHVFAIAAGIVDGMNPKAALMARRIAEVERMGGDDGFPLKRKRLLVSKVKVGKIRIEKNFLLNRKDFFSETNAKCPEKR